MKKALIIGGSRGIGEAVLGAISSDWDTVNISRTVPTDSSQSHHGMDITSDDLPELDKLDALVYCPGTILLKPISSLKEDDFLSALHLDVLGAIKAIKAYHRKLKKSDNASITLFSSVAVQTGMPFHSIVGVAKGAIEGLTRSLAAELAPHIRVNAVAPSITDTPLAAGILRNEETKVRVAERHPLKRILHSNEVAGVVKFLMSDEARGISGQVYAVDNGMGALKL